MEKTKIEILSGKGYIETGIVVYGFQSPYISDTFSDLKYIELYLKNELIIEKLPLPLLRSYVEIPEFYIPANTEYNSTQENITLFGYTVSKIPDELKNKKTIIKHLQIPPEESISIPEDEKWTLYDIRGKVISNDGTNYNIEKGTTNLIEIYDEKEKLIKTQMYNLENEHFFPKLKPIQIKKKIFVRIEPFPAGTISKSLYLMFIFRVEKIEK